MQTLKIVNYLTTIFPSSYPAFNLNHSSISSQLTASKLNMVSTTTIPNLITMRNFSNFSTNGTGNSSLRHAEDHLYSFSEAQIIGWYMLYSIIAVLSVGGNLLVLFVVTRRRVQTVDNIFIVNLAIADLLTGLIAAPFKFQAALIQRWNLPSFMCQLLPFIDTLSLGICVMTLTVCAIDRFIVVFIPETFRRLNRPFAVKIIIGIWIFAIGCSIPFGVLHRVQAFGLEGLMNDTWALDNPDQVEWACAPLYPLETWWRAYNVYLTIIQYFMPLIVIDGVYLAIACKVWLIERNPRRHAAESNQVDVEPMPVTSLSTGPVECHIRRSSSRPAPMASQDSDDDDENPEKRPLRRKSKSCVSNGNERPKCDTELSINGETKRQSLGTLQEEIPEMTPEDEERMRVNKRKVLVLLALVVLLFTFCWLPYETYLFLAELTEDVNNYYYINVVFMSFHCLAMSNSCVNPIIYAVFNRRFRREYREVFLCKCFRKKESDIMLKGLAYHALPLTTLGNGNNKDVDFNLGEYEGTLIAGAWDGCKKKDKAKENDKGAKLDELFLE